MASSIIIVNAAPLVYNTGYQDNSRREPVYTPMSVPSHLPKVYIYAQKGPTTPQLVVGASRDAIFGSDTFDPRKKYFNHATAFANCFNNNANQTMIERILPVDAGPASNIAVSLDVLETDVPQFERNPDGTYKYDLSKNLIPTGLTETGYIVKWVKSFVDTHNELTENFGKLPITDGDQTDPISNAKSKRYPILQLRASSRGSYGNLAGLAFSAPTSGGDNPIDKRPLTNNLAYPYTLKVMRRASANSTPKVVKTMFGEEQLTFLLKPEQTNPSTGQDLSLDRTFLDTYSNTTDDRYPKMEGDFGSLAVYYDNIDLLSRLFYDAEKDIPLGNYDFTGEDEEAYLFNIMGFTASNGVPYYSVYQDVTQDNAIRMTQASVHFADGGSDGTMSIDAFEMAVIDKMAEYADENARVQDIATNPENFFYDSGFKMDTKKEICKFISVRTNTFAVLSVSEYKQGSLTASEKHARAAALRTFALMYPESVTEGTSACRIAVVANDYVIRDSLYRERIPCSYEWADKFSRFAGAATGRWNASQSFVGQPGSNVLLGKDIDETFVPAQGRVRDWDVGMNWVQNSDMKTQYFPAFRTIYPDDTSVLTSVKLNIALLNITSMAHRVAARFSGVDNLTDLQFCQNVKKAMDAEITAVGSFNNEYIVENDVVLTAADKQRGYSYTVWTRVYANNMKTPMNFGIKLYRMSDYAQGQA